MHNFEKSETTEAPIERSSIKVLEANLRLGNTKYKISWNSVHNFLKSETTDPPMKRSSIKIDRS